MIFYSDLPDIVRVILLLVLLLSVTNDLVLLVFTFIQAEFMERRALNVFLILSQIVIGYAIIREGSRYEHIVYSRYYWNPISHIKDVPVSLLMIVIVAMVCYSVQQTLNLVNWWKVHLSAFSIKHSMDALPEGLCYYDEHGKLYIINHTMNEISIALIGRTMRNAKTFYEDIKNGVLVPKESIEISEDNLVVVNAGDSVYSFRKREIENEYGKFYELKVADITEEYDKIQELKAKQEELRIQQEYLSKLGETIKQVTIKKEILAAKINVHDRLGENLIAARRYLSTGEGDTEHIKQLWFDNLTLLENPQTDTKENPLNSILDAAQDIGIILEWTGDIKVEELLDPKNSYDNTTLTLIANILHEVITNTMRHAKGDVVYVDIEKNFKTMTFTNNGEKPTEIIRESGGLLNVRNQAKNVGYKMMIVSFPDFKLIFKSMN